MPDGTSVVLSAPDHYGPYESLRMNRECDLIQARKYRALSKTNDNERLIQWAEIHEHSAEEYTAILNRKGLQ